MAKILVPSCVAIILLISHSFGDGSPASRYDHGNLYRSIITTDDKTPKKEKPCSIRITGDWSDFVNVTVDPNPPRRDELLKLVINVSMKEDIWSMFSRGNITMEGRGIIYYTKSRLLCDVRTRSYLCPAKKGEFRHYEKQFFLGFYPTATYSALLEVSDQDDNQMIALRVGSCYFDET